MWLRGLLTIATCVLVTATDKNHIKQVPLKKCSDKDHLTCLKQNLLRLLTQLGNKTNINLAPGLSLVGTNDTSRLTEEINLDVVKPKTREQYDKFIRAAALQYLNTMNLTLQFRASRVLSEITGFTNEIWTGRSRKTNWYSLVTMAAVSFVMLASLTGKALMASMMALTVSALVAFRGGGGGGGGGRFGSPAGHITQYDIITKPATFATAPAHLYDHEHYHSSAYNAPYAYTRRQNEPFEQDQQKS